MNDGASLALIAGTMLLCVLGGWPKGAGILLAIVALAMVGGALFAPLGWFFRNIAEVTAVGILVVSFFAGLSNALRR